MSTVEAPESEEEGLRYVKMFLGEGNLQPLHWPLSSKSMTHKPGHVNPGPKKPVL